MTRDCATLKELFATKALATCRMTEINELYVNTKHGNTLIRSTTFSIFNKWTVWHHCPLSKDNRKATFKIRSRKLNIEETGY